MLQPEYIDFEPAINAVGNKPAKMGTVLKYNRHSPDAADSTQLAKEFVAIQGEDPGWELTPNNRGVPFAYCKLTIVLTFIDETCILAAKGGGMAMAFRLVQQGLDECVSLALK